MEKRFFKHHLKRLPSGYERHETSKMSLVMFCLNGILLNGGEIDDRDGIVQWILDQYIDDVEFGGFRGSNASGLSSKTPSVHNRGDLPATYTALVSLLLLDQPVTPFKANLTGLVASCQQSNGSFVPFKGSTEADMRFVYCACATSFILQDWSGVQMDQLVEYIKASQSFDGGIGQGPGMESHGGSTFCAIASLHMMNRLDAVNCKRVIKWCCERQQMGFQGRINKDDDTCYSFWIGATLDVLGVYHLVNQETNAAFLATTASKFGGYGKGPGDIPDLLHSSLGTCALHIGKDLCSYLTCPQTKLK